MPTNTKLPLTDIQETEDGIWIPNESIIDGDLEDDDDLPENFMRRGQSLAEMTEGEKKLPHFTQYVIDKGKYMPMQATVNKLPAGYYKPETDHYDGKIYATPKDVTMPKLYDLPNPIHQQVLADINHFWQSEDRYKRFGNVYKRNILLYSIPGNGKTSLISLLANELVNKYDGIIMSIDDEDSLETYPKLMQRIRQIEPERKIITIIEDFDRLVKKDYLSALLLQLLDGAEQLSGVVTIATTNHPESISDQYMSRPSRFNLKIEYKKPTAEVRRYYMTKKLSDAGIELTDNVKADIERYVKKTEGYTFDSVKEIIEGIYVFEIPEDEIFKRVNEAIDHHGAYKITEDTSGKIGFNKA